ncbi:MAG TPA: Na+/H+ antiporter NhaA [Candidatus Melainabacteria bacterium]|nr:Na+/H+ antiporter NhaA [Candidatus Melainabacteria bacterium]HMP52392.1 Na+/H+ antiporter NhaA [Candidatus Melainabacteria bacterium]
MNIFHVNILALWSKLNNCQHRHFQLCFCSCEFGIAFGEWELSKPLAGWVDECLMAFFFLVVLIEF